MYENEPRAFKKYIHVANAVNPKVAEALESLGLVRYNDQSIESDSAMYEYLGELLQTVPEEKREGLYIKMPTVEMKKWMNVLKIFDTRDDDEEDDKDVNPDEKIKRINPKWKRIMRGTGGMKQPASEYYRRQMVAKPNVDPCCDELRNLLFRYI